MQKNKFARAFVVGDLLRSPLRFLRSRLSIGGVLYRTGIAGPQPLASALVAREIRPLTPRPPRGGGPLIRRAPHSLENPYHILRTLSEG